MEEVEEIEIKELWNVFMENLKVILLVTVCATVLGVIFGAKIKAPEYVSSAKVVLVNEDKNLILDKNDISLMQGELALNQKLVATYSEIVKSRLVLENAIKNLNLNITPEELKGKIEVSPVDETEVIDISVKTEEAVLSKNIAEQLVESFKKEVSRIYKIENVQIVDKPVVGKYSFKMAAIKFGAIFGALGLIAMYGIYFLKFIFNNKVSKIEDIEDLKINVLGKIPVAEEGGIK